MSNPDTDTVFVTMYDPNLGNVQVQAPLLAVPTYQSHGWLLLDPNATPPPVATPFLTQAAGDSRYLRAWLGAETLTAGAVRFAPDGHVIVRNANGTTRSTYDSTEQALWTVVGGGVAAVAGLTGSPTAQQIVTALDTPLKAAIDTEGDARYGTLVASKAAARRHGAVLPLPPVGTRTVWPLQLSNGTDTGQNSFIRHLLPAGITEVRFLYVNVYGVQETAGSNAVPVRAGCGLPDGTILPVFFRGARQGSIDAGGYLISDPVAVTKPAYVVSRTNVAVTSGQKWPQGFPDNTTLTSEGAEKGTSITDKTLSGTITNPGNTGVNMYGPSAVIGRQAGGQWALLPAIGAIGDSILYGQGDANFAGDTGYYAGYRGLFERAVAGADGFVSLGSPTETIAQFTQSGKGQLRTLLMQGMTTILAQHGRNDVAGGATFTTTQSLLLQYWTQLANTGAKVYQTTLTPTSTSTDAWTSVGGQTTDATNTVRAQVNDWIRDGAPQIGGGGVATGSNAGGTLRAGAAGHPLTGYFDVADQVETARNSGLWKIDPTQRTVTDAVMNSGSDLITSATAAFVPADVFGTTARVLGAGSSGGVLSSLIRFRNGSTSANLQNTASTSVTGATAVLFSPFTVDGVHPAGKGAAAAAAAINVPLLATVS